MFFLYKSLIQYLKSIIWLRKKKGLVCSTLNCLWQSLLFLFYLKIKVCVFGPKGTATTINAREKGGNTSAKGKRGLFSFSAKFPLRGSKGAAGNVPESIETCDKSFSPISWRIRQGEFICLISVGGCRHKGKSTLQETLPQLTLVPLQKALFVFIKLPLFFSNCSNCVYMWLPEEFLWHLFK